MHCVDPSQEFHKVKLTREKEHHTIMYCVVLPQICKINEDLLGWSSSTLASWDLYLGTLILGILYVGT